MVWDKNKPAGSQKIRLSDDEIRENMDCLEDALSRDHKFPATKGTDAGEHDAATFAKQDADPDAKADTIKVYSKEVDENLRLFARMPGGGITDVLIPAGTKMLFYQDTAPLGWTLESTLDDKVVMITKGKAQGGSPGGEIFLESFAFDNGSNAEDLEENDTIQKTGGASWSCRLRAIEYEGSAPNQTGRIYFDTLADGTPADNDPIEDNNLRIFTAQVNGKVRDVGWAITDFAAHNHSGPNHNHHWYNKKTGAAHDETFDSDGNGIVLNKLAKTAGYRGITTTNDWGLNANYFTDKAGTGNTGNATPSHNGEWRPAAYSCIIAAKD